MGACSSVSKDEPSITDNPSNRRLSQASIAYSNSNRRASQASVGDIQSNRRLSQASTRRRRSSVTFREPLESSKYENDRKPNAHPVCFSEPRVESMVALEDIDLHNSQDIVVAADNTSKTNITIGPSDVPLSLNDEVLMEPVVINSSVLPYSGYQLDDNGVVMKLPGKDVVAELHGNKIYDPLIGEMVYVLDQNAPVDGLERIPASEINGIQLVRNNQAAACVQL